jgi:hypothetical protein
MCGKITGRAGWEVSELSKKRESPEINYRTPRLGSRVFRIRTRGLFTCAYQIGAFLLFQHNIHVRRRLFTVPTKHWRPPIKLFLPYLHLKLLWINTFMRAKTAKSIIWICQHLKQSKCLIPWIAKNINVNHQKIKKNHFSQEQLTTEILGRR